MLNYIETAIGARGLTPDHQKGVRLMNQFATTLEAQGLLPKKFSFELQKNNKDILNFFEPFEIQPFSHREAKILKRNGYFIYTFTCQTIETQMRTEDRLFGYVSDGARDGFGTVNSMTGQVAFCPGRKFFIQGSHDKSLKEQLIITEGYGKDLRERLHLPANISAVIGQAPDYTQLFFAHLKKTGERLFSGEDGGYKYTRTKTLTGHSNAIVIGNFTNNGLCIEDWDHNKGSIHVFVAPLIVSVKTK